MKHAHRTLLAAITSLPTPTARANTAAMVWWPTWRNFTRRSLSNPATGCTVRRPSVWKSGESDRRDGVAGGI